MGRGAPRLVASQLGAIRFWLTRYRYDLVARRRDGALTCFPMTLVCAATDSLLDIALNQAFLLLTAGLYDETVDYIREARETPYTPCVPLWQDNHIEEVARAIKAVRDGAKPVFK